MAYVIDVFDVSLKKRVSVPFAVVNGNKPDLLECLPTAIKFFESTFPRTKYGRIAILCGDLIFKVED